MHSRCPNCSLTYERAPGYFLGSTYINYGLTALLLTGSYVVLHFVLELPNQILIWPLGAFVVLFPLFFFRYARALWLSLDCYFDAAGFESNVDT